MTYDDETSKILDAASALRDAIDWHEAAKEEVQKCAIALTAAHKWFDESLGKRRAAEEQLRKTAVGHDQIYEIAYGVSALG